MLLLAATATGAGLGLCFVTAARTVFDLTPSRGDGPLTAWYVSNYLGAASAVVGVGLLSTTISLTGSVRVIAAIVTAATIGWLAVALLTSYRRSRRPAHRPLPGRGGLRVHRDRRAAAAVDQPRH
jgi:MFS family permease